MGILAVRIVQTVQHPHQLGIIHRVFHKIAELVIRRIVILDEIGEKSCRGKHIGIIFIQALYLVGYGLAVLVEHYGIAHGEDKRVGEKAEKRAFRINITFKEIPCIKKIGLALFGYYIVRSPAYAHIGYELIF